MTPSVCAPGAGANVHSNTPDGFYIFGEQVPTES